MALKANEMVRKIRDKNYEETRGLTIEEQIEYFKVKAERLQKTLKRRKNTLNNPSSRQS